MIALCLALLLAQAPFEWNVPEATSLVDVAGDTSAAGMPMKLTTATTKLAPDQVIGHYARAFARADLFIPPAADQLKVEGALQLSAFDADRKLAYMVIARPLADKGGSKLLLSVAHVEPVKGAAPPTFPGAASVLTTRGEGSRTVTYSVSASAPEVEAFHAAELASRGFKRTGPGTFESTTEQVQLYVRAAPGGRVTVVQRTSPQSSAPSILKLYSPP